MRVLAVTPAYFPARHYGGPVLSTHALACALVELGHEIRVLTTDADGPHARADVATGEEVTLPGGVRVRYARSYGPRPMAPGLVALLPAALAWADAVHVTAVYDFQVVPTLALAKLYDKPVVWSPRGALQRWHGETRLRAKALVERACRAALPRRAVVHVTSEDEAAQSRRRLPGARFAVVPNGVALPPLDELRAAANATLRLLFVGRLHPIKGLENLIDAVALAHEAGVLRPTLAIAGRGEPSYEATLRERVARRGLIDAVRFLGHLDGSAKTAAFAACDVVVVPSFSENFGMTVVEALAHARPVIATRGTPWAALEHEGAGLWVEPTSAALAAAITVVASSPRDAMGARGRAWMEREFGWGGVAARMAALFDEVRRDR